MAYVLVIEDNTEVRKVLRMVLQRAGHLVNDMNHGTCGVAFAQQTQPDVIVLDLEVHGLNGWAILNQLKMHARTKHIPVIGITTQFQLIDRWRVAASGLATILEKPFDIGRILDSVAELSEYRMGPTDANVERQCYH